MTKNITSQRASFPTLMALAVCLGIVLSCASALAEPKHYSMVLGLKNPELRNRAGARALADRVRARFRAAGLTDHKTVVDGQRGEVTIEVYADLTLAQVISIATIRGDLQVRPSVRGVRVLEELREILPLGISLGYQQTGDTADVFLYSKDVDALSRFLKEVSLWQYKVLIGPDRELGYRTWLASTEGPSVGSEGFGAVSISAGTHPNHHYVTAYWDKGETPGKDTLAEIASKAVGGHILAITDGELLGAVAVHEPINNGQLTFLAPPGRPSEQLAQARKIAGLLGSAPHPCEIVVIASKAD